MAMRAFVAGHPISHSLSPVIHQFWIRQHDLQASYDAIDIKPDDLPSLMTRMRRGDYVGGNITIPHKLAALKLCDELDETARAIGAVNTLHVRDNRIFGFNTDAYGFLQNLNQNRPDWPNNLLDIVILGAGGATRAVLHALLELQPRRIIVLNRTVSRAQNLIDDFQLKAGSTELKADSLQASAKHFPHTSLLVNTSALGMGGTRFEGLDISALPASTLVTDIVYTPMKTPLLEDAHKHGLPTLDGLGMLLHQAVPGFEKWFGVRPEVTPELRRLVEAHLP